MHKAEQQVAQEIEAYKYTPLDTTKEQIRLITLTHSSRGADEVACGLEEFDLDKAPNYVTLSYTWGLPTPSQNILVNGNHLQIRQNLYNFLVSYRDDPENIHYLWIDQICIFQAHHGERNQQVQQMSRIYTECHHVIVWLGIGCEEAALVLSDLKHSSLYQLDSSVVTLESTVRSAEVIFHNEYWSRLWIVQELLLPRRVRVLCGTVWIPFSNLIITARRLASRAPRLRLSKALYSIFAHFQMDPTYSAYENPGRNHNSSLHRCLEHFAQQECHDPHDKIYGLLSLVRKEDQVPVDYNKSMQEVFTNVMAVLIRLPPPLFVRHTHALMEPLGLKQYQEGFSVFRQRIQQSIDCMELIKGDGYERPDRWWARSGHTWYSQDCVEPRFDWDLTGPVTDHPPLICHHEWEWVRPAEGGVQPHRRSYSPQLPGPSQFGRESQLFAHGTQTKKRKHREESAEPPSRKGPAQAAFEEELLSLVS